MKLLTPRRVLIGTAGVIVLGLLVDTYGSEGRGNRGAALPEVGQAPGPVPNTPDVIAKAPAQAVTGSSVELSISPKDGRAEVFEEITAIHYSFVIENRGSRPVTITQVVAGCSCNTTHLSTEVIPPRGSAKLGVVYNAAAIHGELPQRKISIYTDAAPEPLTCTVSGVRKSRFVVTPASAHFGKVLRGQTPTITVTLESLHPDLKFAHERTIVDSPWVTGKIERVFRNQAGNPCLSLTLQLHKDAPLGKLVANVFVPRAEDDGVGPSVPVTAEIIGPLTATPAQCFFGVVARSGQYTQTIGVRPSAEGGSAKSLSIVRCEAAPAHPAVGLSKAPTDPHAVVVTLDGTRLPPGLFDHKVRIVAMFNGAECTLEVPLRCLVAPNSGAGAVEPAGAPQGSARP